MNLLVYNSVIILEKKPLSDNVAQHYYVINLKLDNLNPRLPEEATSWTQEEILIYLETHCNLQPIAQSMSDNGYFDEEPLIIIPDEKGKDNFIVIEGNRRLAALFFLTIPRYRILSSYQDIYEKLYESSKENLTQVPAILYKTRDDTIAMMGFRHISGILTWSAYSKARYINSFIQKNQSLNFSEVGKRIGEGTVTVRRNYAAYKIYEQATNLEYDTLKVKNNFAIFYTAFGYTSIQDFIGVSVAGSDIKDLKNPVPKNKYKELKELIFWVHGDKDNKAIINDSRELKYLSAIIESSEALSYLRSGCTLNDAYSLTYTEQKSIVEYLNKASFNIEQTLRYIHRHTKDNLVKDAVIRCAQSLHEVLKKFPEILKDEFSMEEKSE
jgi:hypothetical protein